MSIVKSLDVTGETLSGRPVYRADVKTWGARFEGDIHADGHGCSSAGYDTVEAAEAWIRGEFDSAPPKPVILLPVQKKARELLDLYGDFTHQRALVEKLSVQAFLGYGDEKRLARLIKKTEKKSEQRRDRAVVERDLPGVDWSDDVVVEAVRTLTGDDDDHAANVNNMGWSKADSPTGHWCNAVLCRDRDLAIATARQIVGKYQRQLSMAGGL